MPKSNILTFFYLRLAFMTTDKKNYHIIVTNVYLFKYMKQLIKSKFQFIQERQNEDIIKRRNGRLIILTYPTVIPKYYENLHLQWSDYWQATIVSRPGIYNTQNSNPCSSNKALSPDLISCTAPFMYETIPKIKLVSKKIDGTHIVKYLRIKTRITF